jgi:hypothetical protein
MMKESLRKGELTYAKPEGTDRKYQSIKEVHKPLYTRNTDKPEAGVIPELEGTIRFKDRKKSVQSQNPYDEIIN